MAPPLKTAAKCRASLLGVDSDALAAIFPQLTKINAKAASVKVPPPSARHYNNPFAALDRQPTPAEDVASATAAGLRNRCRTAGWACAGVGRQITLKESGRGSAWLERLVRDQEVGGSNPLAPTKFLKDLQTPHHQIRVQPGSKPRVLPKGSVRGLCSRCRHWVITVFLSKIFCLERFLKSLYRASLRQIPTDRHPLARGARTLRLAWPPGRVVPAGCRQPPVANGAGGARRSSRPAQDVGVTEQNQQRAFSVWVLPLIAARTVCGPASANLNPCSYWPWWS